MRLLLNYKGINKIMLNVQSYNDIIRFVRENFFLKMSKWSMSYTDSDGDQISLDSQLDFQTMLDTIGKEHLKVYIKDREAEQHDLQIGQQINIDIQPTESKLEQPKAEIKQSIEEQQIQISTEKKGIEEIIPQNPTEIKQETLSNQANANQSFDQPKCHRGMWKKKIAQKMAKLVDERVEALIPCIVKKVEDKLKNNQPKPIKTEGIKHEVKCNGCGVEPIVGIRYKCTKCPGFNLCQDCEAQITHNHNMIKMKQIQQVLKQEESFPMWKPYLPSFNPGFMPPPPPSHMGGTVNMPKMNFNQSPFMQNLCNIMNGVAAQNRKDKEDKERSCDPRLKITKKCFKMSKLFGGQPKSYQQFVTKNQDLKLDELSQVYVSMNEGVHISGEQLEKGMEKANKLAFYFKTTPETYTQLIKKNPAANFRQLIKLASSQKEQKDVEKLQEKKPQTKIEQVKTQVKEKEKMEQKIENPKIPVPSPQIVHPPKMFARKSPFDIKKRNQCVLALKDLFGDEKVYDYIGFFNQNQQLSKQEIIQRYIEKLTIKK